MNKYLAVFLIVAQAASAQDLPDEDWLCVADVLKAQFSGNESLESFNNTKFSFNPTQGFKLFSFSNLYGACQNLGGKIACSQIFESDSEQLNVQLFIFEPADRSFNFTTIVEVGNVNSFFGSCSRL